MSCKLEAELRLDEADDESEPVDEEDENESLVVVLEPEEVLERVADGAAVSTEPALEVEGVAVVDEGAAVVSVLLELAVDVGVAVVVVGVNVVLFVLVGVAVTGVAVVGVGVSALEDDPALVEPHPASLLEPHVSALAVVTAAAETNSASALMLIMTTVAKCPDGRNASECGA